jgi:hypothetical protein
MQQRECEGSASYAVALLMSYRRLKKNEDEDYIHLPFTIQEGLGFCKKYNIIDEVSIDSKISLYILCTHAQILQFVHTKLHRFLMIS